jgi:hypothetical protein
MKVLFCDLDGVLHPTGAVSFLADRTISAIGAFCWLNVLRDTLKDFPDVALVLHSTWRLEWETDQELKAQLPPWLAERVLETTPRSIVSRFASIQAYCAQKSIEQYVIIDDEPDAFPPGLPELITCHPKAGLSDPDIEAALWTALKSLTAYKK